MGKQTTIEAVFLEREMVRVEFPHWNLVSDHPSRMGGAGKGPSPGEIMLAALTSASVFSAHDATRRVGVKLTGATARAGMRADRQGVDGPLHALAFLGRFWRRLELEGSLNAEQAAHIGAGVGMLETLRSGLDLQESVDFTHTAERRSPPAWKNDVFLDNESEVAGLRIGDHITGRTEGRWRASATLLDENTALAEIAGAPICISRASGARGPTPHELLLGALAACTAIYVGRNALFHDIPVERVTVRVGAQAPASLSDRVERMVKLTDIAGRLTDAEREKCKFFADYCALGETLKRGAEIVDDVQTLKPRGAGGLRSPFAAIGRVADLPIELECDNGACCVPAPPAKASVPAR